MKQYSWEHEGALWNVELGFGTVQGRVECVSLTIEPPDATEPAVLGRETVRAIPLGRLIDEVRDDPPPELTDLIRRPGSYGVSLGTLRDAGVGPLRRKPRVGRPPIDHAHLVEVASVYLSSPSKPTLTVAEHFHVSQPTAGRWVGRARKAGLLEQTTRGRSSGQPKETK